VTLYYLQVIKAQVHGTQVQNWYPFMFYNALHLVNPELTCTNFLMEQSIINFGEIKMKICVTNAERTFFAYIDLFLVNLHGL
jgi:hypothetical protein